MISPPADYPTIASERKCVCCVKTNARDDDVAKEDTGGLPLILYAMRSNLPHVSANVII